MSNDLHLPVELPTKPVQDPDPFLAPEQSVQVTPTIERPIQNPDPFLAPERSVPVTPTIERSIQDPDPSPAPEQSVPAPLTIERPTRTRQLPTRYQNMADISVFLQDDPTFSPMILSTTAPVLFADSRRKEINGLLEKSVFEVVLISDVSKGTRIFNSRFVDEVKNAGTANAFEKSRLVVQAYNDHGKDLILTQAPTIQQMSQRLILALSPCTDYDLYLRDITQAYVQSITLLNRKFYVQPPQELRLQNNSILKICQS